MKIIIPFILLVINQNIFSQTTFGPQQIISTSAEYPVSIYSTDLDKDGYNDILSASLFDDKIAWYKNNGNGEFSNQIIIDESLNGAYSVFSADLDNDTFFDVIAAGHDDDIVVWYKNDGIGNFGEQKIVSENLNNTFWVISEDIDQDGDFDIISNNQTSFGDSLVWIENEGNGVFCAERNITSGLHVTNSFYAVNFDSDNDLDILCGTYQIYWCENIDGNGNFGTKKLIAERPDEWTNFRMVYYSDIDMDGDFDVLSASEGYSGKIAWYENDGIGNFSDENIIVNYTHDANRVYAADIDNDLDEDIFYTTDAYNNHKIVWIENIGNGNFSEEQLITTSVEGLRSISASDLDNDGDLDLISASTNDDKIAWYENLLASNVKEAETFNKSMIIYPNPTNEIINFDFTSNNIQKIVISNITGKTIIEKIKMQKNETINLSSFESGIYIISIRTDKEIFTNKIIKR